MKYVTLEELRYMTGLCTATLRTYLQGYRFTKFIFYEKVNNRTQMVYQYNKEFRDELKEFLRTKRKCKKNLA